MDSGDHPLRIGTLLVFISHTAVLLYSAIKPNVIIFYMTHQLPFCNIIIFRVYIIKTL